MNVLQVDFLSASLQQREGHGPARESARRDLLILETMDCCLQPRRHRWRLKRPTNRTRDILGEPNLVRHLCTPDYPVLDNKYYPCPGKKTNLIPFAGFSRVVQALEIAWEEVLHPLEVTAKDIKTLQVRFFDTFPFHLLDEKMNDDDVDEVGALLVSENVLQLIGLVCHYLYWAVIYTRVVSVSESYSTQSGELLGVRARRLSSFYEQSSSSSLSPSKGMATAEFTFELPQEEDEAKRTHRIKGIFLAIQTTYAKIEAMTKRNRHAILFHHPLLLLSIRSAVESIFSEEYPLWLTFESEERAWETGNRRHSTSFPSVPSAVGNDGGAAALDGRHSWGSSLYIMDNILTEFFDPNSYHSHITPLESSAHAIRIAQYAKRIDRSRRGKRPARNDQHSAEETVEKVQREGQEDVEHKHGDDLEDKTAREALGDLAHWLPVRPEPGIGRKRQRSER